MKIYGTDYPTHDGTCIRDYTHVQDLAEAHALALKYIFAGGDTDQFNVGTGKGYSVKDVLNAAREVTGTKFSVDEAPRRPGDPPELVANPQKIKQILGWDAKHSAIEKIIDDAWKWENGEEKKSLVIVPQFQMRTL